MGFWNLAKPSDRYSPGCFPPKNQINPQDSRKKLISTNQTFEEIIIDDEPFAKPFANQLLEVISGYQGEEFMHPNTSILLVDDETAITENLASFLKRSGFSVMVASNGEEALSKISSDHPDLLVMDVLMPRMDGREVLRQMRLSGDWTPIILLTQVGEASERAMALEEGADDYLNKPFDPHELVARIRAVLRRALSGQPPLSAAIRLTCDRLVLDRTSHRLWLDKTELALTPKSFMLLEYMMTHPDELVSRERLLDVVWGWDYPVGTRAVDTRISELRRVLDDEPSQPRYIETIPSQGYRFVGKVERNP